MVIDWLIEYEKKFGTNSMICALKEMRYHGKLVINFCDGAPNTSHLEWCVRPYIETGTKAGQE